MNKQRIGRCAIAVWAVSLLTIFWVASAQSVASQVQGGWSEPYRLSSEAGAASEGYSVADQYGYVHVFWTETLFEDQRTIIQYARFDGAAWSTPIEIYVTGSEIENVSPVVDRQGTLHIAWAEGQSGRSGPAYYTHAPANNALSAQNWARPIRMDIPAKTLRLRVDSRGVFHVVYNNQGGEPGVYYVRSEDRGKTWSEPAWLDPDILSDHMPDSLSFELDDADGLHAVWFYGALDRTARPDWVRYVHSLDGGHTWSVPFMIDQVVQESDHNLTTASPVMIVQGQAVHIIWAAGDLPYRHHRFSTDAGQTWSPPRRIFGELHGQAFDGLAVDAAGRVHFFGQIRYPIGIYHAYWDQTRWTSPSLTYLIALEDSEEGFGNRVHAHHTLPVVRAGNQLVLTFADGPADPNRRLFVTHRTVDDLTPFEPAPTPVPTATPIPSPSPTPQRPTPRPTATAPTSYAGAPQPLGPVPGSGLTLQMALIPTLVLLAGTVAIGLWHRLKMR
jgi:hypothetical protein